MPSAVTKNLLISLSIPFYLLNSFSYFCIHIFFCAKCFYSLMNFIFCFHPICRMFADFHYIIQARYIYVQWSSWLLKWKLQHTLHEKRVKKKHYNSKPSKNPAIPYRISKLQRWITLASQARRAMVGRSLYMSKYVSVSCTSRGWPDFTGMGGGGGGQFIAKECTSWDCSHPTLIHRNRLWEKPSTSSLQVSCTILLDDDGTYKKSCKQEWKITFGVLKWGKNFVFGTGIIHPLTQLNLSNYFIELLKHISNGWLYLDLSICQFTEHHLVWRYTGQKVELLLDIVVATVTVEPEAILHRHTTIKFDNCGYQELILKI